MRRIALVALGVLLFGVAPGLSAYAASKQDEDDQRRAAQDAADKKKKEKEKQWNTTPAPLPAVKNAGPCPYVKVLYDAARYVEMKDGSEKPEAVGWTGEIQSVRSVCSYKGSGPITVQAAIDFGLGRGPQARGDSRQYRYWVAVTARNKQVLDKQYFDVVGMFRPGQDRINVTDTLRDIVIPRADAKVSGSNFEVLVGFDVTPEMADFNRQGKRFRVNVTPSETVASATTSAPGAR